MKFSLKELERELFISTEKASPQDALKIERQYKIIEKLKNAETYITPLFEQDGLLYLRKVYAIHTPENLFGRDKNTYATRWLFPDKASSQFLIGSYLANSFPFGTTSIELFDNANVLMSTSTLNNKRVFNKNCPDYSDKLMGHCLTMKDFFTSYAVSWIQDADFNSMPEWLKPCFERAMNERILM